MGLALQQQVVLPTQSALNHLVLQRLNIIEKRIGRISEESKAETKQAQVAKQELIKSLEALLENVGRNASEHEKVLKRLKELPSPDERQFA